MVGKNRDCRKADFSFLAEPWLSRSRSRSWLLDPVALEVEWLLELLMRKKFLILVGKWLDSLECFREGRERAGKFPRFSLFVTADGLAKSCVILGRSRRLLLKPRRATVT
jgi:hypothetical protein